MRGEGLDLRGDGKGGVLNFLAYVLYGAAGTGAMWISRGQCGEMGMIYSAFGLYLLYRGRSGGQREIQRLAAFYFLCMWFGYAGDASWSMDFGESVLRVSAGAGVLVLCALGRVFWRSEKENRVKKAEWERGLAIAMILIAGSMAGLAGLLWNHYGYGYERDGAALGRIAGIGLLWFLTRGILGEYGVRAGVGVLGILYGVS